MYRFTHVFCRVNHGEDLFVCVCVSGTARITSCFVYFDSIATKTTRRQHCKKSNLHTEL